MQQIIFIFYVRTSISTLTLLQLNTSKIQAFITLDTVYFRITIGQRSDKQNVHSKYLQ